MILSRNSENSECFVKTVTNSECFVKTVTNSECFVKTVTNSEGFVLHSSLLCCNTSFSKLNKPNLTLSFVLVAV